MKHTKVGLAVALAACVSLVSTGAVRADYATAVLADNPIGYWRFNDSDDVAQNAGTEGSDYDGTYIDGALVPAETFTLADGRTVTGLGPGNTAFEVGNDVDEYMTVEESLFNDVAEFTMSAWVNPGPRDGNRIGLFGQNDVIEFGFINPNRIQMWTQAGQTLNYDIDPDNQIPENTWFHLATVGNGTSIRLFLNGESLDPAPSYGRSDFDFNIAGGGIYDVTGNQLTGTVDEVAVWNVAISEEQLQAQVAAGKAAGGDYAGAVLADNPLGFWRLNDVGGDTAANAGTAGDRLNGTYNGGDRSANGPDESYGGFGDNNLAFAGEAPDDGFISVEGAPLSGLEEFTLSGWVKPGFITDSRVGLFGQNEALEFGFINPDTIQMWTPDGGSVNYTLAGDVVEDEWVHIAAIGDGEEISIYVDGEFVAAGGTPIDPDAGDPVDTYGASDFFFNVGGGGIYDATGNQFVGQLDEVAVWDVALSDAQILAHFQAALGSVLVGDFNSNGVLDTPDVDDLTGQSAGGTNPKPYDLNDDDLVNATDVRVWIKDLFGSWIGDANLDGEFSTEDLVTVLASGTYEIDTNSVWSTGDFNGDGRTTTGDLVLALADGGYEQGPVPATAAVPEPSSCVLLLTGLLFLKRRRR